MCIWYDCAPEKNVREVVTVFERAGSEESALLPKYIRESDERIVDKVARDICYSLIGAYTNIKQHPLEAALDPRGYTPDHLEKCVIWLIYQTVRTVLRAGRTASSADLAEVQSVWKENPEFTRTINAKMATELESLGHWEWAVLVWLMGKDLYSASTITRQIEELIVRNCEELVRDGDMKNTTSDKERLLVERLRIPISIVKKAKGLYYMGRREWARAIKCLEEAGEWDLTHRLLWENVAPCIVLRSEVSSRAPPLVKAILSTLATHRSEIFHWDYRGSILNRYLGLFVRTHSEPSVISE